MNFKHITNVPYSFVASVSDLYLMLRCKPIPRAMHILAHLIKGKHDVIAFKS